MNIKTRWAFGRTMKALLLLLCSAGIEMKAYASSGQEYITISVDATDENGNSLYYAIDTDDPDAFSTSSEFSVPAGTSHTIYVKDAAGNISSQEFNSSDNPPGAYMQEGTQGGEAEGRRVNIDVTLDDSPDDPGYSRHGGSEPAEPGQGTLYEKVTTDAASQNAERIFYTITTDEGEVFYMVIDQGQSSNNVYLLDQVNLSDLKSLAADDSGDPQTESSSSLLSVLNSSEEDAEENITGNTGVPEKQDTKGSTAKKAVILLFLAAAGGGYYYYKNIYKNKKDEQMDLQDALDRDDFIAGEEEDEEEEADFGLDQDYQEQLMQQLIGEEEEDEEEQETAEHQDEYADDADAERGQAEDDEDDTDEFDEELDGEDDEE